MEFTPKKVFADYKVSTLGHHMNLALMVTWHENIPEDNVLKYEEGFSIKIVLNESGVSMLVQSGIKTKEEAMRIAKSKFSYFMSPNSSHTESELYPQPL